MPRHGSGVLRESFSPGDPEPARGPPAPPARRSAPGKGRAKSRPPAASDGADAFLLNESASVTPRVTFDTGASPATLTRARSRSVDEIQHFLFTVDGLRQLLATFVTLLPVLAIGVIIGMATFYGFGSQCDCNFSQASVALAEYENLTASDLTTSADQWDCCQACWSQPYKHSVEEEWAPTCCEPPPCSRPALAAQIQYLPALV